MKELVQTIARTATDSPQSKQGLMAEHTAQSKQLMNQHAKERKQAGINSVRWSNDVVSNAISNTLLNINIKTLAITAGKENGKYKCYSANMADILDGLTPQAKRVLVTLDEQGIANDYNIKILFDLNLNKLLVMLRTYVKLSNSIQSRDNVVSVDGTTSTITRLVNTLADSREQVSELTAQRATLLVKCNDLIQDLYSTDGCRIVGKRGLAIQMRLDKSSISDIAIHLDTPERTIKRWLKQNSTKI
ncbi:MAG: helix-turn-helix domain-containing protein [Desulfobacterales bacterium]|nr:helix-turn-helix domain-containing protein [Desulfobacterales bacterium]